MSPSPSRRFTPLTAALLVILAAYIAWMLSMPLLPTEDGPVHLYYAQILTRLLTHSDATTAHFFRIKHLLPPYSLYYYTLVALGRFVPFLLADRIVICLYFVLFVTGFRYLARAIGPRAECATLFAAVLLLNWPLGMGFVNFDLALALALWAAGLWVRSLTNASIKRSVLFVVLAAAIMLTHPVPLLFVLGFAALTLVIAAFQHRRSNASSPLPSGFAANLITLFCAALTLVYVKLFTRSNAFRQVDTTNPSFKAELLYRIHRYGSEYGVSFLSGSAPLIRVYRIGLMLVLLGALFVAARKRLRNRRAGVWTIGDTAFVASLLLLLSMPFLPPSVNGSTHFADRVLIFVWIAALLAAAASTAPAPRSSITAAAITGALALNACLLLAANAYIRPLANSIAALEATPVTYEGQLGLIVEDLREPGGTSYANVTWDPYIWAGAHFFRHQNAVLANPPWLDLAIIPIGSRPALPASWIPQRLDDFPLFLSRDLQSSPQHRAAVLSSVDFVFVNQPMRPEVLTLEPMSAGDSALDQSWPCRPGAASWYRLCSRATPNAHP
ncbi:MAG TPA: hypothetical protein VGM11_13890 [Acidobacteriaceae bacterium]